MALNCSTVTVMLANEMIGLSQAQRDSVQGHLRELHAAALRPANLESARVAKVFPSNLGARIAWCSTAAVNR